MSLLLPKKDNHNFIEGELLLINKPLTWTSFDVVNKVRYKLKHSLGIKKIKVGHSGTLDPLATGLLLICTGRFTKKLTELQGLGKTYTGTITLGGTTPSYDLESEVTETFPTDHITEELIESARQQFVGDIAQIPPMFSAIKVDGVRLYKQAREGVEVKRDPRQVNIGRLELSNINLPTVDFEVDCSKGTYIRSLAFDFGKAVNSGGHLSKLVRTKVGDYSLDDAWDLEELLEKIGEYSVT